MDHNQLMRLIQGGLHSPRPDLAKAIEEYHREITEIHRSFMPRELRNLAFALARSKMEEQLKQYFL